jgi:hypothetical protein
VNIPMLLFCLKSRTSTPLHSVRQKMISAGIFFLVFCFIPLIQTHAVDIKGKDLLDFFGATCPSQGEWTRKVLNDSEALIKILQNVDKDPDCRTISGALAQIGLLQNTVMNFENYQGAQKQLQTLRLQEQELSLQLSTATSDSERSQIQAYLREIQLQKIALTATNESLASSLKQIDKSYAQLIAISNAALQTAARSPLCFEKNPSLLTTLVSVTTAVGSALTVTNPALSLGLSATSTLFGQTLESLRNWRNQIRISRIATDNQTQFGLLCAMESLSNRWCELNETESMLELKFRTSVEAQLDSDFGAVIRLYDEDVPILLDWLAKIRTGGRASSTADAFTRSGVNTRLQDVLDARNQGDGLYSQNRPLYLKATTSTERWLILKRIVISFIRFTGGVSSIGGDSNQKALYQIYDSSYAPYYLLGLSRSADIPRENGVLKDFSRVDLSELEKLPGFKLDLEVFRKQLESWVQDAEKMVNSEILNIQQPDPLEVLTRAYEKGNGQRKKAPIETIESLILFLRSNYPQVHRNNHRPFKKLYEDLISRLEQIVVLLDEVIKEKPDSDETSAPLKPQEIVDKIAEIAELKYGTVVFSARLEMITRLSIDEYLKKNPSSDQNVVIQFLYANSFLEVLNLVSGKTSDEYLMEDVKQAKIGAYSNLNNFSVLFKEHFEKLAQRLDQITRDPKIDKKVKQDHERQLARLCLHVGSLPLEKANFPFEQCRGKKLLPFMPGGPESAVIDEDYFEKPFEERVCQYRNFIRRSSVYRQWRIRKD